MSDAKRCELRQWVTEEWSEMRTSQRANLSSSAAVEAQRLHNEAIEKELQAMAADNDPRRFLATRLDVEWKGLVATFVSWTWRIGDASEAENTAPESRTDVHSLDPARPVVFGPVAINAAD